MSFMSHIPLRPTALRFLNAAPRVATRSLLLCAVVVAGGGCASTGGQPGVLDKALEAVGLAKPAAPDIPVEGVRLTPPPQKITLRLHAGDIVNTDTNGRPLALVARVYKLRSPTALLQAPYDAFKDAASEKRLLGDDIVEVRELVMTPGKKHEVVETMPAGATHIAVIALLRAPDPDRWKFVFAAKDAARTGITLGMHACALSVAEGEPIAVPLEVRRLAGMRCPSR